MKELLSFLLCLLMTFYSLCPDAFAFNQQKTAISETDKTLIEHASNLESATLQSNALRQETGRLRKQASTASPDNAIILRKQALKKLKTAYSILNIAISDANKDIAVVEEKMKEAFSDGSALATLEESRKHYIEAFFEAEELRETVKYEIDILNASLNGVPYKFSYSDKVVFAESEDDIYLVTDAAKVLYHLVSKQGTVTEPMAIRTSTSTITNTISVNLIQKIKAIINIAKAQPTKCDAGMDVVNFFRSINEWLTVHGFTREGGLIYDSVESVGMIIYHITWNAADRHFVRGLLGLPGNIVRITALFLSNHNPATGIRKLLEMVGVTLPESAWTSLGALTKGSIIYVAIGTVFEGCQAAVLAWDPVQHSYSFADGWNAVTGQWEKLPEDFWENRAPSNPEEWGTSAWERRAGGVHIT